MTARILTRLILLLMPALCAAQSDSVYYGVASYYHNKFQGRKTSNGEIFRNDSLTAAHKRFPFGTLVRVTNLSNDSTVIVRINDRLPQSSRRTIDLSQAAARKLNMMKAGIVKARIEVLAPQETDTVIIVNKVDTTGLRNVVMTVLKDSVRGSREVSKPDTLGEVLFQSLRQGDCNIERITVKKDGKTAVYEKKIYAWGGVFFYRDNEAITEPVYKKETGTK